jgi:cob(I)alamin adenosyltransferase
MILIYTGEGKGKTSAALGQVLRAMGHGLRVACAQFMKRDGVAGEQVMLRQLLKDDFLAGGLGFLKEGKEFARHRTANLYTLDWIREKLVAGAQVCILDESICALNQGLIQPQEMESLLSLAAEQRAHLVLTGRNAPDWLVKRADVVTEMLCRKHHFTDGQGAIRGIEF